MQVQFDSCRRLSSRCRICDCVVRCSPRQGIGIQQWHPAMAPYHMALTMASSNGTTSTLPKCVITTPRLLHPAMAPYRIASSHAYQMASINGIQQWHPAMAPYQMAPSDGTLPWYPASSNGTQQWYPAMAPYHGTQQWHRAMASSNGAVPWHPAMAPRPVCQNVS